MAGRSGAGLVSELGGALDRIEAITGSRPTAAAQSLQLLWLQRHDPDRVQRIAKSCA